MRKIDLHIHTISTISDIDFEFDLEKLKEYITKSCLECISVTNHNLFDQDQFSEICEGIDVPVFPGIEINLGTGHVLIISDNKEIGDFQRKCDEVKSRIKVKTDSISSEELIDIFEDLSKYIVIPHYSKKPIIHENELKIIETYITSGEVSSPKKFIYSIKDKTNPSPSYFSDIRISKEMKTYSSRHTFVDLNDISFLSLKDCLSNKNKVFLSQEEGNNFFQIFDDGLKLSTKLNVIIGERSSGKTHTLKRIFKSVENVKYIEQFSLLVKEDDSDIKEFEDGIKSEQSLVN